MSQDDEQSDGAADGLNAATRDAIASLDQLATAPLPEHIDRYQQIHSGLQDALGSIEGV